MVLGFHALLLVSHSRTFSMRKSIKQSQRKEEHFFFFRKLFLYLKKGIFLVGCLLTQHRVRPIRGLVLISGCILTWHNLVHRILLVQLAVVLPNAHPAKPLTWVERYGPYYFLGWISVVAGFALSYTRISYPLCCPYHFIFGLPQRQLGMHSTRTINKTKLAIVSVAGVVQYRHAHGRPGGCGNSCNYNDIIAMFIGLHDRIYAIRTCAQACPSKK